MNYSEHKTEAEPKTVKPRRIDGPHTTSLQMAEAPALVVEPLAVGAGQSATCLAEPAGWAGDGARPLEGLLELEESFSSREEQFEQQTAQLANQLQAQLRELESRESYQNARAAELDNDYRRARLWISEKTAELYEREKAVAAAEARHAAERAEAERQLTQSGESAASETAHKLKLSEARLREVDARHDVLTKSEQELARRQQFLGEREEELAERDRQLESKEFALRERRQFIEREAAALHHSRQAWEASQQGEQRLLAEQRASLRAELESELSRREDALRTGEALLAEHTHTLERDEQTLTRERSQWQRQVAADRQALEFERRRAQEDLELRRSGLAARESALDKQQTAIEQMRAEITAAHRQSLEMRLIAEQLWGQIQGRVPPAEATQSLAQLRQRLGEQYRLEQQGLAQQKEELLALAEKVAEQSGALRRQRQELQAWHAAREEAIERHAQSLVAREQELQGLAVQLAQDDSQRNSDRRRREKQLRESGRS